MLSLVITDHCIIGVFADFEDCTAVTVLLDGEEARLQIEEELNFTEVVWQ